MSATAIRDAFVENVGTLTGMTLSVEGALTEGIAPTFTVEPLMPLQEDVETGPAMEVTYRWLIRIYVDHESIEQAHEDLSQLAYQVYRSPRVNGSLDDTCAYHYIEPRDDEIGFLTLSGGRKMAVGRLVLRAETDES